MAKKIVKMSEISLGEFVEKVLASDEKLAISVKENGIDTKDLLKSPFDKAQGYGVETGLGFGRSALYTALREANSDVHTGLLVGMRDSQRFTRPIDLMLIRSNGEHMAIQTWDRELNYGSDKIPLPIPSVIELKCKYNEKYDSNTAIGISKYSNRSKRNILDALDKVADLPSDIGKSSLYKIAVVRGVIARIEPIPQYNDNKEITKFIPVAHDNMCDTPEMTPTIQIKLANDNNTYARATFNRQRYGNPYFAISDFDQLIHDALENHESPKNQAEFISRALVGREVYIVGVVTKYEKKRNKQNELVTNISINAGAIFDLYVDDNEEVEEVEETDVEDEEVDVKKSGNGKRGEIDENPDDDVEVNEEEEEVKPVKKSPKETPKPKPKPKAVEEESGDDDALVNRAKSLITKYLRVLDISPDDISSEQIKTQVLVKEDVKNTPIGVIDQILDEIRAEMNGDDEE